MAGNHCDKFWVLGVPDLVFEEDNSISLKSEFEGTFRTFGDVKFRYFKTLSRVLIIYDNEECALLALHNLQDIEFQGINLKVTPINPVTIGDSKLSLPDKGKQFLISPPASPPVGWEPIEENAPVVDYNLIAAMSRLRLPGDQQIVHQGINNVPSIVITCEFEEDEDRGYICMSSLPSSLVQTSRPPLH